MNKVWIACDWHLYNTKPNNQHPFRTKHSIGKLGDNYGYMVDETDFFIYLGDLCDFETMTDRQIQNVKDIISNIKGYKIMCRGNHDTMDDSFYLDLGFDEIYDIAVMGNIVYSHKPVVVYPNQLNIHAHLHYEKYTALDDHHINAYGANYQKEDQPVEVGWLIQNASNITTDPDSVTSRKMFGNFHECLELKHLNDYDSIGYLDSLLYDYPVDETASEYDDEDDTILDEILFSDISQTKYFEADDSSYQKHLDSAEYDDSKPVIKVAHKNDVVAESSSGGSKEYKRMDDIKPIDRDDKKRIADKYGIRPIGMEDPKEAEEHNKSPEDRLAEKREARNKQLKRARSIKKRKATIRKIKSKIPFVKNESAVDDSDVPDMEVENSPLYGQKKDFFYNYDYPKEYNSSAEKLSETVYKSTINPNHKQKGHIELSSLKRIDVTEEWRKAHRIEHPWLKHVPSSDDDLDVSAWLDGDNLVAAISVDRNPSKRDKIWIHNIHIEPKYRGYGLSKQLLDYAIRNYGANALAVKIDNKVAQKVYLDYGFTFGTGTNDTMGNSKIMYLNEMAYEDYCDHFVMKLKSLASEYNKRNDIFKHVAKILKIDQKDLPKFECHVQVSGEKQLCFSMVNPDTSFEIRCEYEKYLKEMIKDLEKDKETQEDCPHVTSIWTADAEGTIYVDLDYEHINEAAIKRVADNGTPVPTTCPKCGSKIGLYLKGEPVWLCSNKKCGTYYGTAPMNEAAMCTTPLYYLSYENMHDDLYPVGKCLFSTIDQAVSEVVFESKNKHPQNKIKIPCDMFVHVTEPGYYDLRSSDMVCGAKWSLDNITLNCVGTVHINADGSYDLNMNQINETIQQTFTVKVKESRNPNDNNAKAVDLSFYQNGHKIGEAGVSGYESGKGFLYNMEVSKKYRGKGYGTKIMQHILSHYKVSDLSVDANNVAAIKLYTKFGFKRKKSFYDKTQKKTFDWYQREPVLLTENSPKLHVYTEPLYRITYNGIGIYEAYKKVCSFDEWRSFINSDAATWLDVPKVYNRDINHTSYFTERGYEVFQKNTYPIMIQKLNKRNIKVDQVVLDVKPVYEDLYQIVVPNHIGESSIQESYKFEPVDKHIKFFDKLDESTGKDEKLYPVYVMLVHSGTTVSNIIKAVSKSTYSHASISFDSSMDHMYSFARKDPRNPFIGGFRYESIGKGFYEQKEVPYAVYMIPCTESQIKRMKKRLVYFEKNKDDFTFDFSGLVTNYLGIVNNPEHRWFCSRFVSDVLNAGAPKNAPYVKNPSLQDPDDFTRDEYALYVTSGENLMKYNKKKVDKITNKLLREYKMKKMIQNENVLFDLDPNLPYTGEVLEYQLTMIDESVVDNFLQYMRSFHIQLDKDGNVILTRRAYNQLDRHFKETQRMLRLQKKTGDIEGMKLNLAKLNYIIGLIDEEYLQKSTVSKSPMVRKDMLDLRSVMLNVLKQYLQYVIELDPKFNFQSYYNSSVYGKEVRIPISGVVAIGKSLKTLL